MLLVSTILLIPLVFQFVYVGPFLRDREIQRELDAQEASGKLLSERTDNIIMKYRAWLENIRQHESVRHLDPEGIEIDLSMRLDVLEWMHALAVVDQTLTVIYTTAEPGFDETLAGYLRDGTPSPTDVLSGPVRLYEETGQLVFPLYEPIPSTDSSELDGFLLGVFDLDEMERRLTEDLRSVESTAFLVDQRGRLLVDCCVGEGKIVSLTDLSSHPAVQHIIENPTSTEHHHTVANDKILATCTILAHVPWAVVVETPLSEIVGRSSVLGRWILTVNSSVLGIMLALAWTVALWIARERGRHERKLYAAARRDALTGLRNRFALEESIPQEEARAQRYGHPVGVLMIDVNHFKEVNDQFGHPMGDKVLQGVADVLRKSVRETDIVFRYGGDEFLVLLPETLGETEVVRQRIQEGVSRRNETNPLLDFPVTLAIGLVEWEPQMKASLEQIIDLADSKMYSNKRETSEEQSL
ncbi:diguanylate cyclase [Candidatus Bipolaricaulota bacterium]|nr:diguanylate cyclase [Candidatus Bipolaricaulota bacterium]